MKSYFTLSTFAILALAGIGSTSAQVTAYDSIVGPSQILRPGLVEVADQIILAPGTPRLMDTFTFQFWAQGFSGNEGVRLQLYENDGPVVDGSAVAPGTMFYDNMLIPEPEWLSGGIQSVTLDMRGRNFQLSDSFTWSLQIVGVVEGEDAGVVLFSPPGARAQDGQITYDPPAVGGNYDRIWQKPLSSSPWALVPLEDSFAQFGAQVTVVPEPGETCVIFLVTCAAFVAWRNRQTGGIAPHCADAEL
jgi:hypothetical protein